MKTTFKDLPIEIPSDEMLSVFKVQINPATNEFRLLLARPAVAGTENTHKILTVVTGAASYEAFRERGEPKVKVTSLVLEELPHPLTEQDFYITGSLVMKFTSDVNARFNALGHTGMLYKEPYLSDLLNIVASGWHSRLTDLYGKLGAKDGYEKDEVLKAYHRLLFVEDIEDKIQKGIIK
jgi:hypothetical protein